MTFHLTWQPERKGLLRWCSPANRRAVPSCGIWEMRNSDSRPQPCYRCCHPAFAALNAAIWPVSPLLPLREWTRGQSTVPFECSSRVIDWPSAGTTHLLTSQIKGRRQIWIARAGSVSSAIALLLKVLSHSYAMKQLAELYSADADRRRATGSLLGYKLIMESILYRQIGPPVTSSQRYYT